MIDWVLTDTHSLPRAHLLVEFAAVLMDRLNKAGHYRRRLALALAAADAAHVLERRTVEGWLRSDAIPWTLMEQRRDFTGARGHLEAGLAIAEALRHADMTATALAFLALSYLKQANTTLAQGYLDRAKQIDASPGAQMRVQWVAGDLALAQGRIDDAVSAFQQAEVIDLSFANSRHTTVTPSFRLCVLYRSVGEPAAARREMTDLIGNAAEPLSSIRLVRAGFELAHISRAERDYASARRYAEEAAVALRTVEESMRLNQQIRAFLADLPR